MQSARRSRFRRFVTLAALIATTTLAQAAEKPFSATLSDEQKKAAGIDHLTPNQTAALDNLVQREMLLAKQGDTVGFSKEFSQRRSSPELAKAGLDKLTPQQRAQLDAQVANAIASQPRQIVATTVSKNVTSAVQGIGPHPEIHGSISFVAGTSGGGRNFYGGAVTLEQTDPVKGYSIAVSYAELHGKGFPTYCPVGYAYGYPWPGHWW